MLGSLCLELGGGRSRQVPSQGTWQAGHTVGIQGSAHDTQGALPAGLLQPWFRGAGEPGLGHSVLGGLVWPSGAAIWLQSGPLLAVVPPSHASSNEQLCAPHRVFLCYAFICCAPEPCSLPRVPSGLSSPWHSSGFLLFGCCGNQSHRMAWVGRHLKTICFLSCAIGRDSFH